MPLVRFGPTVALLKCDFCRLVRALPPVRFPYLFVTMNRPLVAPGFLRLLVAGPIGLAKVLFGSRAIMRLLAWLFVRR